MTHFSAITRNGVMKRLHSIKIIDYFFIYGILIYIFSLFTNSSIQAGEFLAINIIFCLIAKPTLKSLQKPISKFQNCFVIVNLTTLLHQVSNGFFALNLLLAKKKGINKLLHMLLTDNLTEINEQYLIRVCLGTTGQDVGFDGTGSVIFADLHIFHNLFNYTPESSGISNASLT